MASAPGMNTTTELPLPAAQTLVEAAKLAQKFDRPIQLDYYAETFYKRAFVGGVNKKRIQSGNYLNRE